MTDQIEKLITKPPLLRWWLFVVVMVLAAFTAFKTGIIDAVYDVDVTGLSFLIMGILTVMSVKCGIDTFKLTSHDDITEKDINESYAKAELGWFVSDLCLTIGMIGTVAGFIYMLSSSFANIDVSNVSSLQNVLSHMSAGMATALYTTAAGLVSSAFLKLQYFNYSAEVDRLADETPYEFGTKIDDSEKT